MNSLRLSRVLFNVNVRCTKYILDQKSVYVKTPVICTNGFILSHSFCRFKHSKRKKFRNNDDDDDDDDDVFDDDNNYNSDSVDPFYFEDMEKDPVFKEITVVVSSPRFDKVIRTGLGLTRSTAEDAFFSGRYRLNGEKVLKKSVGVRLGDKLDLIGTEGDESIGKRVRILDIKETKELLKYRISVRCWRKNIKL